MTAAESIRPTVQFTLDPPAGWSARERQSAVVSTKRPIRGFETLICKKVDAIEIGHGVLSGIPMRTDTSGRSTWSMWLLSGHVTSVLSH
jgi:hypothetical protein